MAYYTINGILQLNARELMAMEVYLVRHGEAVSEAADPRRPLSARGRADVEKVALGAAARKVQVAEILHSGKLRAQQTAEIIAQLVHLQSVRETRGLSPQDDPLIAKAELETAERPLMLVGHLPHLSLLASALVTGEPGREEVRFSPATIICLSREAESWRVCWTLSPESL